MNDRSTFRVSGAVTGFCFISMFSSNLMIDTWCSLSESVNHISDQGSNVSQDLWSVNFVFDVSWEVRMCCEVLFRLLRGMLLRALWYGLEYSMVKCPRNCSVSILEAFSENASTLWWSDSKLFFAAVLKSLLSKFAKSN